MWRRRRGSGPVEAATKSLWHYAATLGLDATAWQVYEALAVELARQIDASAGHSDVAAMTSELRVLVAALLGEITQLEMDTAGPQQNVGVPTIGFQPPQRKDDQQ